MAKRATFTEQARRAQLTGVTIELVAAHGYAGTSLARIAEAAGISKAAVLYHFASKDAVVAAAQEQVLAELVEHVGAAVRTAGPRGAAAAYVRSMTGYFRDRPEHARMIIEATVHGHGAGAPERRWGPLAAMLTGTEQERRSTAVVLSGAIDGIVAEGLADPGFDTAAAADLLVALVLGA